MTLRLLAVALAWLSLLALAGCTPRVAGTDDVELTYDLVHPEDAAEPPGFGEDLRALVLRRLSAVHVGADVVDEGRRVRIVVAEPLVPAVDELVTWTGTLHLFEVDPSDAVRSVRGTEPEVRRAAEQARSDTRTRVIVEPVWEKAGAVPATWRTRIVQPVPVGELAEGTSVAWGERGTLRLRTKPETAAFSTLADARLRAREVVAVRARTSLGPVRFDGEDTAILSFGSTLDAYGRAQQEMHLLTTPRLPLLRRTGAVGLPPNTALAAACFVVPVLLSIAWLAFVRRFDRAHPEPIWLVLVTFLLGAVATVPAALVEYGLTRVSPWLDPRTVTFGGRAFALPIAFVVFTLVVGVVEEGAKLSAALFAARRREFDEPIDGVVYGIVASLGFAAAENIQYFGIGRLNAPLVIARCFMSIPAHMFGGAIWGYALGARLVHRRHRVALWFLFAAAAHGLFDALLSVEGAGTLAVALNVALASLFVALVRRALRHGVIDDAARAVAADERLLFRVGRPIVFWLSAAALHVLAFGLFMLGAWYQLARHRPSVGFVAGSSILLLLLALAAYGVSAAVPLDVAIDSYGVTFAGAARPWRKIRGFSPKTDHVELDCDGGPLLLGPAERDVVAAIAAALRPYLGGPPGDRAHTLESG